MPCPHYRDPAAEFYVSNRTQCKVCIRARSTANRNANIERARAYDRERAKRPERIAKFQEWLGAHWKQFPAVRAAQVAVGNAVRDRRLKKRPCEVCGATRAHAHHDDYLRPLDVRWLCPEHHSAWHRQNGPGRNYDAQPQNDTQKESA